MTSGRGRGSRFTSATAGRTSLSVDHSGLGASELEVGGRGDGGEEETAKEEGPKVSSTPSPPFAPHSA